MESRSSLTVEKRTEGKFKLFSKKLEVRIGFSETATSWRPECTTESLMQVYNCSELKNFQNTKSRYRKHGLQQK